MCKKRKALRVREGFCWVTDVAWELLPDESMSLAVHLSFMIYLPGKEVYRLRLSRSSLSISTRHLWHNTFLLVFLQRIHFMASPPLHLWGERAFRVQRFQQRQSDKSLYPFLIISPNMLGSANTNVLPSWVK
jgi:hypothetical protein